MRHSPWSLITIGLAVASLALLGGTTISARLTPYAAAYGVLILAATLYAAVLLIARDRARRQRGRTENQPHIETVAGRRVF